MVYLLLLRSLVQGALFFSAILNVIAVIKHIICTLVLTKVSIFVVDHILVYDMYVGLVAVYFVLALMLYYRRKAVAYLCGFLPFFPFLPFIYFEFEC